MLFDENSEKAVRCVLTAFCIITLVLKAAKQPLTTARSAGEIKA
jgi:hypothetical protein